MMKRNIVPLLIISIFIIDGCEKSGLIKKSIPNYSGLINVNVAEENYSIFTNCIYQTFLFHLEDFYRVTNLPYYQDIYFNEYFQELIEKNSDKNGLALTDIQFLYTNLVNSINTFEILSPELYFQLIYGGIDYRVLYEYYYKINTGYKNENDLNNLNGKFIINLLASSSAAIRKGIYSEPYKNFKRYDNNNYKAYNGFLFNNGVVYRKKNQWPNLDRLKNPVMEKCIQYGFKIDFKDAFILPVDKTDFIKNGGIFSILETMQKDYGTIKFLGNCLKNELFINDELKWRDIVFLKCGDLFFWLARYLYIIEYINNLKINEKDFYKRLASDDGAVFIIQNIMFTFNKELALFNNILSNDLSNNKLENKSYKIKIEKVVFVLNTFLNDYSNLDCLFHLSEKMVSLKDLDLNNNKNMLENYGCKVFNNNMMGD